jgi:selenocysteine lyase/cysteine desulfurase
MALDVAPSPCKKHLFDLDGVHYLSAAYMSPLSKPVEAAGVAGMRRKRVPWTLSAPDFFEDSERIRRSFAALINASPETIAVLPAVSYGMAIVAKNTPVRAGQNIVLSGKEFPTGVYTWKRLCDEQGLELRMVPPPPTLKDRGPRWNEALLRAIDAGTALVSISHVHCLDGTVFDLEAIGRAVHRHGGALIVDGTQSLGVEPLDAQRIQADVVLAAGYKSLMGPFSIAMGYFGSRYLRGAPIEENWLNRVGSDDQRNLLTNYRMEYRPGARRFDVGQSSNFILAPMMATALEQVLEWGVETIAAYTAELTRQIERDARALGFEVSDAGQRGRHFIALSPPPATEMDRLEAALRSANVFVSVRDSFLRVAVGIYNDEEDVAALRDALTPFGAVHP